MKRAPAAKPPPPPARRRPVTLSLPLAVAFVLAAALFLGWRVRAIRSAAAPAVPVLITSGDTLPPPPPLAPDDREALKARLDALGPLWNAVHQNPNNQNAWLALAEATMEAGDNLSARAACRAALRCGSAPVNPLAYEALGEAALALGLSDEAAQTYRGLTERFPAQAAGYVGLSRALQTLGRTPEAAKILERGLSFVAPNDVPGRLQIARQFEDFGDAARALTVAQAARAAALDSQAQEEATLAATHLLLLLQQPSAAKPLLESLLAHNPDSAPARYQLAVALDSPLLPPNEVPAASAETVLLETMRRAPGDTPAVKRLAALYYEQGRFREAVAAYVRLLQMQPDQPAAVRLHLAHALRRLGDTTESARQQQLATLLLARERTATRLTRRRDENPRNAGARRELARHYAAVGRFAGALAELQSAFCLAPSDPAVRSELRALYRTIGVAPPPPVSEPDGR